MIELKVGKLFLSLELNPVAPAGKLGVMVRPDKNAFLNNKPSIIVVWENDKFTEHFEDEIGVELELTDSKTSFLDSIDFSTDQKITEAIKSSFFKKLFTQLQSNAEIKPAE